MPTQMLEAPDAPIRIAAPIEHITKVIDPATGQWDGTLVIHVTATSETPDSQGEIVNYDAAKAASPEFLKWAGLTEMHDEGTSPGTALKLYFDDSARKIEADLHVVDPVAVKKVLARVYKAVSMGGIKLATRLVSIAGRTYREITKLRWDELALVTKPANPDAMIAKQFILAKRGDDMDAIDAGVSSPLGGAAISVDRRTPEQAAIDETRDALAKAEAADPAVGGGKVRSEIPKANFVFPEDAPDGGFPITAAGDVTDAVSSWGRYKGPHSFDEFKTRLTSIANRLGFASSLPEAWKETKMAKAAVAAPAAEPEEKPAFPGAKPAIKAKKSKVAKSAEEVQMDTEAKRLAKEAAKLRKLRKARKTLAKLSKNDALDAGHEAQAAIADATAEEQKEHAEGSDESADLAALAAADEAIHTFTDAEAKEPDEGMEKRYRAIRKQAARYRKFRKASVALKREERRLLKAGARNSAQDAKQHEQIHSALLSLGYTKCMTKAEHVPASPSGIVPASTVATSSTEGTIAKSDTTNELRDALAGVIPTDKLDAIEKLLTTQGEQLAKVASRPAGGGPATAFAPVFRGQTGAPVSDKASVLEAAVSVIDDPRLKEQVGSAAAEEMIRRSRNG